jgi:TPR repeat protein
LSLYERACQGSSALGCRNLGLALENGRGTAPDRARALEAFRKGCGLNDADACSNATRLSER